MQCRTAKGWVQIVPTLPCRLQEESRKIAKRGGKVAGVARKETEIGRKDHD